MALTKMPWKLRCRRGRKRSRSRLWGDPESNLLFGEPGAGANLLSVTFNPVSPGWAGESISPKESSHPCYTNQHQNIPTSWSLEPEYFLSLSPSKSLAVAGREASGANSPTQTSEGQVEKLFQPKIFHM